MSEVSEKMEIKQKLKEGKGKLVRLRIGTEPTATGNTSRAHGTGRRGGK